MKDKLTRDRQLLLSEDFESEKFGQVWMVTRKDDERLLAWRLKKPLIKKIRK